MYHRAKVRAQSPRFVVAQFIFRRPKPGVCRLFLVQAGQWLNFASCLILKLQHHEKVTRNPGPHFFLDNVYPVHLCVH